MVASPWLDERASLLVEYLGGHGLELPHAEARRHISDHLDLVAEMMRIGRQAAKFYVTDEVVMKMAARLAGHVERHDAAIDAGDVACLDTKRRRRFPSPPPNPGV